MTALLTLIHSTPPWAFAVLAALIVLGIQALRTRIVPLWRVLAVPSAFILWGVIALESRSSAAPLLALDWLATAGLGLALGWLATRLHGMRVDPSGASVELPGSIAPLLRNLAIFAAKYALTAAITVAPASAAALVPWDVAVSGLSAGYFIGWLGRFARKYRATRRAAAKARPAACIDRRGGAMV